MLTPDGELLCALLSVRGDESDEAKYFRTRMLAKLAAKRIHEELLVTLAEGRWLHKERFPIIDRLTLEGVLYGAMLLDELALLIGIRVDEAVGVDKEWAGENSWCTAFLVLPKLKTLLRC